MTSLRVPASFVVVLACLAASSCGTPIEETAVLPASVPIAGNLPYVQPGSSPPAALTWKIGITEDVWPHEMQRLYAALVATNNALWSLTEGQVRIEHVVIRDNVAPGITAGTFVARLDAINTSDLDVLVWPRENWDFPAAGAVIAYGGVGRAGRMIILPLDPSTFVLLHEASHLVWDLSWDVGRMLVDEYTDGIQDPSCVMESQNFPVRWCSDPNHVHQTSQPHSCWQQILHDYPAFQHTGTDIASNLPPPPTVTYEDQ